MHSELAAITARIVERSRDTRAQYLQKINRAKGAHGGRARKHLSCGNFAHGIAACGPEQKTDLMADSAANFGIISAYNEMLSAHQPYHDYPEFIQAAAQKYGASAQFAGGVPAMCDGVTQGRAGMELSLFSRDVIAMATAIALSHDMFDGALYLGVCDKIVPGLMIGALSFGHLPSVFVPAGPMTSGLPNNEKARVRQLFAQGKVGREELLEAESASYHSAGTCTFYGTANTNQMLMEIMGLQLPGSSFVNPGTALRSALTDSAVKSLAELSQSESPLALADIVDEKSLVNGMVGLMATGGSTNHAIHIMAIARAAGVIVDWQDLSDISALTPLLCRIYPNGVADVNHFHAAGGMTFLMSELLNAGLLHEDVNTIMGRGGLSDFTKEPFLGDASAEVQWKKGPDASLDQDILRSAESPFNTHGGLNLLKGNLGRAVIKVSAVKEEHHNITAPALVFNSQEEFLNKFNRNELEQDFVAVLKFQGPKANGMPELHKLTPPLGVLQDKGFKVALVTDGRMSGASGKVPAAIHLTPEALDGGPIGLIRDGDIIELHADAGTLSLKVEEAELKQRIALAPDLSENDEGMGRELFTPMKSLVGSAETGATIFNWGS